MALVNTLHKGKLGQMDDSVLEKREGVVDTEVEYTTWVEYWFEGELVHRSAHVTIKQGHGIPVIEGSFA